MSCLTKHRETLAKVNATYDKLFRQIDKGMFLDNDLVTEWSDTVELANRFGFHAEADKLVRLLAKPRGDAGKSISKPGATRQALATDAFNSLFVEGQL